MKTLTIGISVPLPCPYYQKGGQGKRDPQKDRESESVPREKEKSKKDYSPHSRRGVLRSSVQLPIDGGFGGFTPQFK